jgi:hypothetical protein
MSVYCVYVCVVYVLCVVVYEEYVREQLNVIAYLVNEAKANANVRICE